jgi:uncharacterized protein (TIGR04255 family)
LSFRDLAYERVKYGRTGLKTVVCQLRFNPILRIGQELPVAFQDRVRQEFPKFIREESSGIQIGPGGVAEALPASPAVWRFRTEDEAWTASLGVASLSLETTKYLEFPDFERRLLIAEEALRSVYGIEHYVRVGLRYINLFQPDEFPGGWLDKLNPQLLGPMADGALGHQVAESVQVFLLVDDDWTIRVRHGTDGKAYQLDIDHATEARVGATDVVERLRAFNRGIYQVFRWSISERMHHEMEPGRHD